MLKAIITVWAWVMLNVCVIAQERVPKETQFVVGGTNLLSEKNPRFAGLYPAGVRLVFNYGW
ncbi:MAG: hypothetical protein GXO48_04620 [Chlorobi bacterium]|nr:hypothetical protein [Chlorobiota bacterium]